MSDKTPFLRRAGDGMDRVLSVFAPKAAHKRMTYRAASALLSMRTNYRAASVDRARGNWVPGSLSADAALLNELPRIRDRSRDLVRNNPIASGAIDTFVTEVIRDGLHPQSSIEPEAIEAPQVVAEAIQKRIDAAFRIWSPHADAGRRHDFFGLQDLMLRHWLVCGESLAVRRDIATSESPYLLRFEIVEADRLANPSGGARMSDLKDKHIREGVELGPHGEPVAYWIRKGHPGDFVMTAGGRRGEDANDFQRIPTFGPDGRRNVYHLYKQKRTGSTRGAPFFAPVISFFDHVDQYTESELMAGRVASLFVGFIRKVDADLAAVGNATSTDADGNRIEKLSPGMLEYLEEGGGCAVRAAESSWWIL